MSEKGFRQRLANQEETKPLHYTTCQWQRGDKSVVYFVYRLVSFVWFVEALVLSFIKVKYAPQYWPIYYTHWSFALATIQSAIALVLVSMNQADAYSAKGGRIQNRVCTIYECLFASALTQAICVTILFWGFVYNPRMGSPDIQTIQVHAINSVMMLLDFSLVAFPLRMIMVVFPFTISLTYLLFTYIYYASGGRRFDGKVFIYKILDWTEPGRTGLFSVIVAVLIIALFFLLWLVSLGRKAVHGKLNRRSDTSIVYKA